MFKRIFRFIWKGSLILFSIILVLLVSVVLLIRLPSIQQKLLHTITHFVSDKTKTTVAISEIGISFPNSVYLKNIYLDDLNRDTLLSAGYLEVNLDLFGLVRNRIDIRSVKLYDVVADIYRHPADSNFNFNFLVSAFAGNKKPEKADTVQKPINFSIGEIGLKQVRLNYLDSSGNILVTGALLSLNVFAEKTDLNSLEFRVRQLALDGADVTVMIPGKGKESESTGNGQLPLITLSSLKISKSNFRFRSDADSMALSVAGINIEGSDLKADVRQDSYGARSLHLKDCMTAIRIRNGDAVRDTVTQTDLEPHKGITVNVNELTVMNTSFLYDGSSSQAKQQFDPEHMAFKNINLSLQNSFFGGALDIKSDIRQLSFSDQNGFAVKQLSGQAALQKNGLGVKNLLLRTNRTEMQGDLASAYRSFDDLKKNIGEVTVDVKLGTSLISHADLIYFVPTLSEVPYFVSNASTGITADFSGPVKNLSGRMLNIRAGDQTSIKTSFTIRGLPDISTAIFEIPNAELNTSAADIQHFLPLNTIPPDIRLPAEIKSNLSFSGSLSGFSSHLNIHSTYGGADLKLALINKNVYNFSVVTDEFNAGALLNQTGQLGKISMAGEINGSGLELHEIAAQAKLSVSSIEFNHYRYRDISIDAAAMHETFDVSFNIRDSNAMASLNGHARIGGQRDSISLNGTINGIDLMNLHLSTTDLRMAGEINFTLQRDTMQGYVTGKGSVAHATVRSGNTSYFIDTVLTAEINKRDSLETGRSMAIVSLQVNGDVEPLSLSHSLMACTNRYYFIDSIAGNSVPQHFDFNMTINNHPALTEVLIKDLKKLLPVKMNGKYYSDECFMEMYAEIPQVDYQDLSVSNAELNLATGDSGIQLSVNVEQILNGPINVENTRIQISLANQQANIAFRTGRDNENNKTAFYATLSKRENRDLQIRLKDAVTLNSLEWKVPEDNEMIIGKNILVIHHFGFENGAQKIQIEKTQQHDTLKIYINDFGLENLTSMLNKDSVLLQGRLNGDFRMAESGALKADMELKKLRFRLNDIGDVSFRAHSLNAFAYDLELMLKGGGNEAGLRGTVSVEKNNSSLDLKADIKNLTMVTVEALSLGQLKESTGNVNGALTVSGDFTHPIINGDLHFENAATVPAFTNNKIILKHETISISDDKITFPDFTIRDRDDHPAVVSGQVYKNGFSDFRFDLGIKTDDFILLNTTKKENEVFFGSVVTDCNLKLTGDFKLPHISADIAIKKGTHFTYAVPQSLTSTDKGEGVILFEDTNNTSIIITGGAHGTEMKSIMHGIDLTANIRMDPGAILNILIDPVSGDSLTVQGNATLSLAIDLGGKISLTGRYELTDGSYLVSLQQLIRKRFKIQPGSSITFNGDPLDADVNIKAVYHVTTSPVDLIASSSGPMTEEELRVYQQRLPFEVYLMLTEKLLAPNISFAIELPDEYKGAMGGTVNTKLNMLKEDQSQLNKQVFALLLLNKFVQQDPFTTSGNNSAESAVRTSVSEFLTNQLNQLSSRYVKGVELTVDLQSYGSTSDPNSAATTDLTVGVKKAFLKNRLSVQVGGTVDVEGDNQSSSQGDLSGNLLVEYKLTKDGRLGLKVFRQNDYEDYTEGEVVETGVGIVYTRNFGKWRDVIKGPEKKKDE